LQANVTERNPVIVTAPGDREIVVERVFDAPRRAVFAAYTQPDLLRRWFGPHGYTLTDCVIDLTVGGHWRYVVRGDDDGSEMILQGYYREVDPPMLLVTTQVFGDVYIADNASLASARFDEYDGRTRLTITVRYATGEERDQMATSGMAEGMGQGYERLDDLLATT
jgi:uncharacterized protein YndB with AHSA1/START domain